MLCVASNFLLSAILLVIRFLFIINVTLFLNSEQCVLIFGFVTVLMEFQVSDS